MDKEIKYSGYGYHGGGRKKTGIKRVTVHISGQPDEILALKNKAKENGKNLSCFILDELVRK